MSSLCCMYCQPSVPEQGGIPLQGLKLLPCKKADGMVALYWSPVISGCVIRNSAELPYLEEEERRPWGKLRLWQEFIIAFHPIYIDFVPICTRPQREENTPVDMMFTVPLNSQVAWGQTCSSGVVILRRLVGLKTNKDEQRNRNSSMNFVLPSRGWEPASVEEFHYLVVLFTKWEEVGVWDRQLDGCGVCSHVVAVSICRGDEGAKLKGRALHLLG